MKETEEKINWSLNLVNLLSKISYLFSSSFVVYKSYNWFIYEFTNKELTYINVLSMITFVKVLFSAFRKYEQKNKEKTPEDEIIYYVLHPWIVLGISYLIHLI